MARVKMAVDEWRRYQKDIDLEDSERIVIPVASGMFSGHWRLGSPVPCVSPHRLEAERKNDPAFRDFNMRLREYIAQHHPAHQVRLEQQIQVSSFSLILAVQLFSSFRLNSARLSTWSTSPKSTGEAREIFYAVIRTSTVLPGSTR
jgi:hypothetical protein